MLKKLLTLRIIFVAAASLFIEAHTFAASYYSIVSGNWNSASTWSSTSGGSPGTTIPGNNDVVYIENGHTITVTAAASCRDLFFTGANATLTINSGITLDVKFTVTLYKQVTSNSSCSVTGSGTFECKDIVVGSNDNAPPAAGSSIYTHTFRSSVATITVTNDILINSYFGTASNLRNGVFQLESGVLTVENNIASNNANGSNTSEFSMAAGAQTGTLKLLWSNPFNLSATGTNNINLNGTSTLVNYARAGGGAQTVYATTYNNLTLSVTGAKTVTGSVINGILSLEGAATAAGTTPTYGAAATIQYKGSAAQTTGIEFPAVFNGTGGIRLDNTNGLTLNSNRTIEALLTFVNGKINTGANTLTLTSSAAVSGAGAGKYVNGNLQKGIAAGTLSKTYEVGDATVYAPVQITFSGTVSTAGNITVKTTAGDHPAIATSTFNPGVTVNRYWTINNNGVAGYTFYNATLNFVSADVDAGADYNYFYAGNYLASWIYPAIGTLTSTSVQVTGLTTFGDFQLGERPVSSFRSVQSGNWNQTATWQSFDGTNWVAAASTPSSASGYIIVRSPHVVTITASVTADQVIIDAGGRINLATGMTVNDGASIDFTVNGTLDCSGSVLTGAGSFMLEIGGDLIIGSQDGITSSGAAGNIQTTVRMFSTAANYTYNGISSQVTGTGLPAVVKNLTINNNSGVSLTSGLTLDGTLTLTTGAFSTGSATLVFQGSDTPLSRISGTITTGTATNLVFGTTGNTAGAAFSIPPGTFTSPPVINNLTINRINILTLNDQIMSVGGIVLCNGPLETNGNLVLISTAVQTALIDGSGTGTITGNVTMQRYLPSGFGYKYFSSPFQASTVNEFADDINLASAFTTFYRYDENRMVGLPPVPASGWVSYKVTTNVLNPMAGYAVNFGSNPAPGTFDVTGVVNNGNFSVTLYNNNQVYTKGFNLVGNPYPSPVNWDIVKLSNTNIDDALYYFQSSTTDQYVGTYVTYINGISTGGSNLNIIPSMQGFFVHVTNGTFPVSGTLNMTNSARITDLTHPYLKSAKTESASLIRLSATFKDDAVSVDRMVIYFDDLATEALDSRYDALKLMNTDLKVPNLYSVLPGGSKLSINALPINTDPFQIALGLKANRAGTISIKLVNADRVLSSRGIHLFDAVTGIRQSLLDGNEYAVTLAAGEYLNRFYLSIGSIPTGISSSVEETKPDFTVYSAGGLLKLNIERLPGNSGTLILYNILGEPLFRERIDGPGYYEFAPGLRDGIYIAAIISGNKRLTRKVYISGK